jgi:Protein of unknown function (DUF2490)
MRSITKTIPRGLIAALVIFTTTAARAETDDDNRIWLNLNAQGKLPIEGINWFAELQPRWHNNGRELDQLLLRPAIFYKLSERSSLWLGYANAQTRTTRSGTTEEYRIWQQFSYTFKLGTVALQSRTRLEQRKLDTGDDIGYRLRQMVRLTMPSEQAPKFSLIGSNEVFVNLNDTDWGMRSGFDQNRLFFGIGYSVNSKLRLEAGYLNQHVNTATIDRRNHVLSTSLSFTF